MKPMTPEDEQHLRSLNRRVKDAIEARDRWVDEKVIEYADMKVGDLLYDLDSGKLEGTITKVFQHRDYSGCLCASYKFMDSKNGNEYESGDRDLGSKSEWNRRILMKIERMQSRIIK